MMAKDKSIIELTSRHFRILDLRIRGLGISDIARQIGMSRPMVSIIINSPTFKHELAMRRAIQEDMSNQHQVEEDDEVTKTLREGAKKAASKLVGHVSSMDAAISVRSCAEVLDRTGYTKKVEAGAAAAIGPTIVISGDDAKVLVETIELRYGKASKTAGCEDGK